MSTRRKRPKHKPTRAERDRAQLAELRRTVAETTAAQLDLIVEATR